jgi:hypothetical protein
MDPGNKSRFLDALDGASDGASDGRASDGASETSPNELYDLLDAAGNMCAENTVGSFGLEELSEFRSASSMLGDAALAPEFEVYRSVNAIDISERHVMAQGGEAGLDLPFQLQATPPGAKGAKAEDRLEEPAPRTFERLRLEHTHMYVCCPLAELHSLVNGELLDRKVDSMFVGRGCFWRAMCYPEEPFEAVDLRIYVNSLPQLGRNRYLVEFVRRSGDHMAFNRLFESVRDAVLARDKLTKDNGDRVRSLLDLPVPFAALAPAAAQHLQQQQRGGPGALSRSTSTGSASGRIPALAALDDGDLDVLAAQMSTDKMPDVALFRPLVDMSESAFEDVHVQGLALVSCEARKEGLAQRMCAAFPEVVDLLLRRLAESRHPEVRRHCCTALCAMAAVPALHQQLILKGACKSLVAVAAAPYSRVTSETQRQAAGALSNLCANADSLAAVYEAVADKGALFEELALKCDDQRLAQSIAQVRNSLAAC